MSGKTYDFNTYLAATPLTDFVLNVSEKESITIPPPDLNAALELDEGVPSRRSLELLCGGQWPAVLNLMGSHQPCVLNAFLVDLKKHFGLDGA